MIAVPAQATLIFHGDGDPQTQVFDAPADADREFLGRFLQEAYRLESVTKRLPPSKINLNLRFGQEGEESSATWEGMPEDLYAALLLRIRPFILANEEFFYFKVNSYFARTFTSAEARIMLKQIGGLFRGDHVMSGIDARQAIPELYSDKLLYDYLNAEEYHRDEKKIARLADGGSFMYAFRKYAAFETLHHKLRAIMLQAGLAAALVEDKPFSFRTVITND